MRKAYLLSGFALVMAGGACDSSDSTPTPTPATTVEITVRDANSWSITNPALSTVSGATINVYSSAADAAAANPVKYTATTNQAGKATVTLAYQPQYFFTAQLGAAKNTVNDVLVLGVYQTQAEVDASLILPAPQVGAVKLWDANGDGIINARDATYADVINVVQNQAVAITSVIYH